MHVVSSESRGGGKGWGGWVEPGAPLNCRQTQIFGPFSFDHNSLSFQSILIKVGILLVLHLINKATKFQKDRSTNKKVMAP